MFIKDRLDITSERQYTDEGFLIVPARIARIGVQDYLAAELGLVDRNPTDIVKVYRPEEEVFSDISLDSFANKPITNEHPPELIDSKNSRQFTIGHSGPNVSKDGMFAKTTLHIIDAEAISNIESGKTELSNGYTCDLDWTPGLSPNGENYDTIQRKIKGNHIAIVKKGRAGSACRVADNSPPNPGDKAVMAKITIDGVDFEVSDQAAQAVGKLQARVTDAEKLTEEEQAKLKAKEDEMEEAKKEASKTTDSLQAKLDAAESKIPDGKTLDTLVTARTETIDQARKVYPEIKWEGKDNAAIMAEVVAAKCPAIQMDAKSEDYIKARFDTLVESVVGNPQQHLDTALVKQLNDKDGDKDNRPSDVIAREKMMADSRDAWKGGKS